MKRPVYISVENSTGTKKCEFYIKISMLEPISAYVILMCCEKQSIIPRR